MLPKGEETVIKNLTNITENQKKKISLARALYCDPDILILDAIFETFDLDTKNIIFGNLCNNYKKMTFLISSHKTTFLKPENKVVLFQNGALKEMDMFKDLLNNKISYIH